jgi:hypothetical protein
MIMRLESFPAAFGLSLLLHCSVIAAGVVLWKPSGAERHAGHTGAGP